MKNYKTVLWIRPGHFQHRHDTPYRGSSFLGSWKVYSNNMKTLLSMMADQVWPLTHILFLFTLCKNHLPTLGGKRLLSFLPATPSSWSQILKGFLGLHNDPFKGLRKRLTQTLIVRFLKKHFFRPIYLIWKSQQNRIELVTRPSNLI